MKFRKKKLSLERNGADFVQLFKWPKSEEETKGITGLKEYNCRKREDIVLKAGGKVASRKENMKGIAQEPSKPKIDQ